ncbi:MAG TPA: hypothetical protein VF759_10410 [Allosphingosinicella sp.]|jgi:hypothetical protein
MPLALFPELTFMLRRIGKTLAPWSRLVRIEELLIRRAESAYLTHWFGRRVPETQLNLHISIRNIAELREQYQAAKRSQPGAIPELSLLGPLAGISGLLVGIALSPTGLIMIASQVKRIAAAMSDAPWYKKLGMILGGIILLLVPGLAPALVVGIGLPVALIGALGMAVGGNAETRSTLTLLADLAALFDALGRFWDEISGPREKIRNPLLRRIFETLDLFAGLFVQVLGLVGFLLVKVAPIIPNLLGQFRALSSLISVAMEALKEVLTDIGKALFAPFEEGNGLLDVLMGVLDTLMAIPEKVVERIKGLIGLAEHELGKAADRIFLEIEYYSIGIVERLQVAFEDTALGQMIARIKSLVEMLDKFMFAYDALPKPAEDTGPSIKEKIDKWYLKIVTGGGILDTSVITRAVETLDAVDNLKLPDLPNISKPSIPTAPKLPDIDKLMKANPRPELPDIGKMARGLVTDAWAAQASAPVPKELKRSPASAFAEERKRLEAKGKEPALALNNSALRDLVYLAVGRVLPPALRDYAPQMRAYFDRLDEQLYKAPEMDEKARKAAAEKLLPVQDLGDTGELFPKIAKIRFKARDGQAPDLRAFRDIVLDHIGRQTYVARAAVAAG